MTQIDKRTLPLIALIAAMLIGGIGNTLLATNPTNPWVFIALRYLLALTILSYWIPKSFKLSNPLKLAALLETLSIATLVIALTNVSVALATTIGSLSPMIALLCTVGLNIITLKWGFLS